MLYTKIQTWASTSANRDKVFYNTSKQPSYKFRIQTINSKRTIHSVDGNHEVLQLLSKLNKVS